MLMGCSLRSRFPDGRGVWHKNGAMALHKPRRALPPLDRKQLQDIALRYVSRYATTRAKLRSYLQRKIRERGWDDAREADLEGVAKRFAELGYIDDAGFALSKSRSLTRRGYGKQRLMQKLHSAGIGDEDRTAALDHADEEAVRAALRFAERRKVGPFACDRNAGRPERERAIAAMVRAGHGLALARAIVDLTPGAEVDLDDLAGRAGMPNT
jgi:regulatory protein